MAVSDPQTEPSKGLLQRIYDAWLPDEPFDEGRRDALKLGGSAAFTLLSGGWGASLAKVVDVIQSTQGEEMVQLVAKQLWQRSPDFPGGSMAYNPRWYMRQVIRAKLSDVGTHDTPEAINTVHSSLGDYRKTLLDDRLPELIYQHLQSDGAGDIEKSLKCPDFLKRVESAMMEIADDTVSTADTARFVDSVLNDYKESGQRFDMGQTQDAIRSYYKDARYEGQKMLRQRFSAQLLNTSYEEAQTIDERLKLDADIEATRNSRIEYDCTAKPMRIGANAEIAITRYHIAPANQSTPINRPEERQKLGVVTRVLVSDIPTSHGVYLEDHKGFQQAETQLRNGHIAVASTRMGTYIFVANDIDNELPAITDLKENLNRWVARTSERSTNQSKSV